MPQFLLSICKCGEKITERIEYCNEGREIWLIRECPNCNYLEEWPLYY